MTLLTFIQSDEQITQGFVILITGLIIVFSSLLALFLFFRFGMSYLLYIYKVITRRRDKKIEEIKVEADEDFTGEIAAAISTAIHLYLHEQHDNENPILTIKTAKKSYSPWSSKIYGTHNSRM